jgi:hypothetical protein
MYLRYFLWNFVGRQNDIQGYGSSNAGNFATGIPFFDDNLIFPISKGPAKFSQHIAYNKYYALPLLFGIVGLFFLRKRYKLAYAVSLSLFLFTGLAIILYLNQTPNQARERDYAYVGSFYAFGIFIAMGFLALFLEILKRKPNSKYILWGTFLVSSFVPLNLLTQNYDDHDRSGRYIARDWAKNYLDSCEPNAILFTYGDNDTFPLWYVQDVEGFRTDVRIVNLSLLGTDWYIDQCKRTSYKSEPLPILMNRGQYVQGRRDVIALFDQVKQPILLQNAYKAILSDNDMDKLELSSGNKINYLPAKTFLLPANQNIRQWTDTLQHKLSDTLVWKYSGDYLFKNDLAVLDLLTHFNWKRPVYFAVSVGEDNLYNLQKYLRLDGLAYKLTPQQNDSLANGIGWIDTDILYKNLIEKFQWGGVEKQSNLFDYQLNRSVRLMELRKIFKRLATALVAKHDNTRAVIVLDRIMKLLPINKMPFEMQLVEYVELYYKAGALAKADNLSNELWDDVTADAAFYYDLPDRFISDIDSERNTSLLAMKQLMQLAKKYQRIQNLNKMKTSIVDVLGGNPFEKEL